MNAFQAPAQQSATHLQGRWLSLARAGGIVLSVLALAAFVLMLPTYAGFLQPLCSGSDCLVGQLHAATLPQPGISVDTSTISRFIFTFVSVSMCLSVAAVIFWRKPDDWMALLAALMLVLMATGSVTYSLMQSPSPWQLPALFLNIVTFTGFFLVFSLFPNGRFVPFWIGWLPALWFCWGMVVLVWHADPVVNRLHDLVWACALFGVMLAQIHRYRHVSTPMQRQQTKWVVWGASIAITIALLFDLPQVFLPGLMQRNMLYRLLNASADTVALCLGASSIGMAVLRSRLWEIDHLINRTIVYGSLTALLALFYVGLIVTLQVVVHAFTGQISQSLAMVVLSTLVIAALFQPLRNRLQRAIDRHFYRQMYDAQQTLSAFGETLSSELDLDQMCERVVAVVEGTMKPTHISLWLLQPVSAETHKTRLLPLINESAVELSRPELHSALSGAPGETRPTRIA